MVPALEIVSRVQRKLRLEDELDSCNIVDGLAVSDQKQPHPTAWDRKMDGCSAVWHNLLCEKRRKRASRGKFHWKDKCRLVSNALNEKVDCLSSLLPHDLNLNKRLTLENSAITTKKGSNQVSAFHYV